MVNWRAGPGGGQDAGKAKMIDGAPVLIRQENPGVALLHAGWPNRRTVSMSAPSGQWIIGSGKLSPTTTVFNMEKIQKAIEEEDFEDTIDGIPVLTYSSVREAEIPVGLGPRCTPSSTIVATPTPRCLWRAPWPSGSCRPTTTPRT